MYFGLRPGLSFCISVDRVILLDLAIGRYFSLPPHFHESFSRWASGAQPADDDLDHLQKLINEGIFVTLPQRPDPELTISAKSLHQPRKSMLVTRTRRSHPSSGQYGLVYCG